MIDAVTCVPVLKEDTAEVTRADTPASLRYPAEPTSVSKSALASYVDAAFACDSYEDETADAVK